VIAPRRRRQESHCGLANPWQEHAEGGALLGGRVQRKLAVMSTGDFSRAMYRPSPSPFPPSGAARRNGSKIRSRSPSGMGAPSLCTAISTWSALPAIADAHGLVWSTMHDRVHRQVREQLLHPAGIPLARSFTLHLEHDFSRPGCAALVSLDDLGGGLRQVHRSRRHRDAPLPAARG